MSLRAIPKDADVEDCELCGLDFDIKDMRQEQEEGNWICKKCIGEINQSKENN